MILIQKYEYIFKKGHESKGIKACLKSGQILCVLYVLTY